MSALSSLIQNRRNRFSFPMSSSCKQVTYTGHLVSFQIGVADLAAGSDCTQLNITKNVNEMNHLS